MMERLLSLAKLAAWSGLACLLLTLAWQVRSTGLKLNATIDQVEQTTAETHKRIADTSSNVNALLIQLGLTADEARRAAIEQRAYWDKAGAETVRALGKTNDVLDQANRTLSSVDESQRRIADQTIAALSSLPASVQAATGAMNQAAADLRSANTILQDPNIPQTLAHLNSTASHLDSTSASIDVAVKRWTKPVPIWRSIFMGALDSTSKVAMIAK